MRPTGRGKGHFQPVHVRDGVAMEPVPGRYNNGSGTQTHTHTQFDFIQSIIQINFALKRTCLYVSDDCEQLQSEISTETNDYDGDFDEHLSALRAHQPGFTAVFVIFIIILLLITITYNDR